MLPLTIETPVVILGMASALVDYSEFCYLWQLKEYRIDRMRDFFSTAQGKRFWIKYNILIRSVVALVAFFWPLNLLTTMQYVLLCIFAVDCFRAFLLYYRGKLLYPKPTIKSFSIVFSALLLGGFFIVTSGDWATMFLILIGRFFILSFTVLFFQIITKILKKWFIYCATKKLKRYTNLKIIGITGSYGKTSVKQFLNHILGGSFRVVSTPEHTNTEIGVAKFILKTSFSDVDIFIVEMGAYRIGEIKMIADMVKPQIGILTAINEQHLSLFGSIKNTQKAKYELLHSLPNNGLAITNADNKYCIELIDSVKAHVKTFGMEEEKKPTLFLTAADQTSNGVVCEFQTQDKRKLSIKSSMPGAHNCMNLAPCLIVAMHLGVPESLMLERSKTLGQSVMALKTIDYGSSIVIDDSYNSNPDGFKSALHYLSSFSSDKKRIVITRGMYELADKSREAHEKIGGEIAFCADQLIIIDRDYEDAFRSGMVDKYKTTIEVIDKTDQLLERIRKLKSTNSVILVENRVPKIIAEELGI